MRFDLFSICNWSAWMPASFRVGGIGGTEGWYVCGKATIWGELAPETGHSLKCIDVASIYSPSSCAGMPLMSATQLTREVLLPWIEECSPNVCNTQVRLLCCSKTSKTSHICFSLFSNVFWTGQVVDEATASLTSSAPTPRVPLPVRHSLT